jgi:hypothetical protein
MWRLLRLGYPNQARRCEAKADVTDIDKNIILVTATRITVVKWFRLQAPEEKASF